MSDFNYNNNGDNGNKPPTQKSQIIVIAVVLAAFGVIFYGARSQNIGMAMGGFFAAFITMVVAALLQGKNKGAGGVKSGISGAKVNTTQLNKYMPLLADERTKQHPEVQRLLQYPAVQKAFFDPCSLSNSTTANDEHVRELFLVFDEMLAQGVINGDISNYGNNGFGVPQSGYAPMQTAKPESRKKPENTPRRKLGLVLQLVGACMFFLPFVLAFIQAMGGDKASNLLGIMSFVMTCAAPFGMMLLVVGIIMRRR